MGLLGLSLLTTQRRIKEIGVRKVNGAGTAQILAMLNWDFMKWILISFLLAIPIAFLAMNKWLESFAYKTNLSWWIFALAGIIASLIALLTVSIQSWRASSKNPIEALRYE
jgi:putative ABC transport system permease protein